MRNAEKGFKPFYNQHLALCAKSPLNNPLLKAELVESRWNSFGRTDLMKYKDDESVMLLFIDGGAGTVMYRFSGDLENPGEDIEQLKAELLQKGALKKL